MEDEEWEEEDEDEEYEDEDEDDEGEESDEEQGTWPQMMFPKPFIAMCVGWSSFVPRKHLIRR